MGCCFSDEKDSNQDPGSADPLLNPVQNTGHLPHYSGSANDLGSAASERNDQAALNEILQQIANDVIDVTLNASQDLEESEHHDRRRQYKERLRSARGTNGRSVLPPAPSHVLQPQALLQARPINTSDINLVNRASEGSAAAVSAIDILHGEDLVIMLQPQRD